MTPFNVCPACVRLNLPDAIVCSTCGAGLSGTVPQGDILADPQAPRPGVPPERQPAAPTPPPRHNAGPANGNTSPVAKAATKLLRRAHVRRKLLANKGQPAGDAVPADVLVLEGDDEAREQLCALLEAFGFRTHPVQNTMEAARMLDAKRYTAAFLNLAFDGSAAPASHDLCSRVKAPTTHASDTVCALIVVTGAAARPVERVRAELAGCDAFLLKPVSRGAVAQALEACGVALPIDARRA